MTWLPYVVLAILFFWLGYFTCYMVSSLSGKNIDIKTIVTLMVALVFTVGMMVEFLNPAYKLPLGVIGLMGAIVGSFYKAWKDDKSKDNNK